jgi:hypothetical protein
VQTSVPTIEVLKSILAQNITVAPLSQNEGAPDWGVVFFGPSLTTADLQTFGRFGPTS